MKLELRIILLTMFLAFAKTAGGQDIFRFDHIGSEEGLSQNTAFSILFDSRGFMWIGTMNGLNRYDGYEFRIFRSSQTGPGSFTNNRVINLWEDSMGFIWLETYDGYYHFFNPVTEIFHSIPPYEGPDVQNGAMKIFLQYSDEIIFLGSSESGLYVLRYDGSKKTYDIKRLAANEDEGTGSRVRFIHRDSSGNLWAGTRKGVWFISVESVNNGEYTITPKYSDVSFTSVCETTDEIWFGSEGKGIFTFNKVTAETGNLNAEGNPELKSNFITHLYHTRNGIILAGFRDKGLMYTKVGGGVWKDLQFHSGNIDRIYEDKYDQLWLTAAEFGVTRFNLRDLSSKFYNLTPDEIKPLTDLERPHFYEDTHGNLWLGLHGNGLGIYDRINDTFRFYRNDPGDPNTISSNFVHCITEDKSGQLWVGTGQVLGGIVKVIPVNRAFNHYQPEKRPSDILDNVSRAVLEDRNRYLWVATKSGKIHLFDSTMTQKRVFYSLPGLAHESMRNITYTLFNDSRGYLWVGSKGYGLSVSTMPLMDYSSDYNNLKFRRYTSTPGDRSSLGNNNIYSICEDLSGGIWIGTYGNGLSLARRNENNKISFVRINHENSNLSGNQIRHLLVDSSGNLWIATTFGLNLLERKDLEAGNYNFRIFLKDPSDEKSLIYNDVIHIFEDSEKRIWLGTFGGGIELLLNYGKDSAEFKHYGIEYPAGSGIVYGILEDNSGNIWYSTENGLARLDPVSGNCEIFNNYNGLGFNSFSENTCCRTIDGRLIFGGNEGIEIIDAALLGNESKTTRVELTKFLLFNKEVSTGQKNSPLSKSISFLDELTLKHFQSSFSIDFSALDYLDPQQAQYTYRLDNFETSWNNIGYQHRATYTNLSPGRYIFRVKASLNEGKTSSPERILKIRIMHPWWKTLPAYIVYAVLAGLIAYMIFRMVSRINRYKNELAIEKKVNELKLQFYTNISHEIRTPLTMIIGPLEDMIADKAFTHGRKLQMGIMLKNARRMLNLTNQLLDFRKIQNNKMILKVREIDIVSFTKDIFSSFGPLARHKGITCSFISDKESITIWADPNKLDIIIYNIISNALKFTGTGRNVTIKINDSYKNSYVDISVTDEGPGIPQKNLSDIFTRYTILSNQDLAGTGIGLSLSYELARLHRGDLLIESVEGKGSTFTIRMLKGKEHLLNAQGIVFDEQHGEPERYLHSGESREIFTEEGQMHSADPTGRSLMLVVEDNNEILNYICQSLKSHFNTISARNGEEGLHLAITMNPDIIITDIRMPGIDGMEMTKRLKDDFLTSHIPVIMLTAKSEVRDQIEGIETGAEAYITKPFNMEYLKSVAVNLLSQRAKVLAHLFNNTSNGNGSLKINSKDTEFLNTIIKCVEEKCPGELSIDILAEKCNVSRTVLYNKIKGLTGSSPVEFIRRLKMDIALKLLENGYNVSEAAYKTGFSDVKYFSRLFKLQFGYSPSRHKSDR